MEDQVKSKKSHLIDKIIEDLPTLYQKKYKLIKEKNDLSKFSEISRMKSTDNLHFFTTWDLMLMQIKELALDFHEERKWKKGISYNLIHKVSQKYKKNKTKQKINDLYKKSCCLYLAMTVNFNIREICNGNTNEKMNSGLNQLIKETMSINDLRNDISNKKATVEKLKYKVEKVFGKKFESAANLVKIFKQMENMIIQSEKQIDTSNNGAQKMNIDSTSPEPTDFPQKGFDNQIGRINKMYESVQDSTSFKTDRSNSNINLNIINSEINNVLQDLEEYTNKTNNVEINFPSEENDIFSNEIKLFYEFPAETDQFKSFITEKLPKSNVTFLPEYDNRQTIVSHVLETDENNFEKNFEKFFPSILRISEKNDVVMFDDMKRKDIKLPNNIQTFTNYSNYRLTILQKLVYLWGISRYGPNLNILYDLPNIFPFSKSIYFDKEDEFREYLNELMKEFDVDFEGSSFDNLVTLKDTSVFNIKGDPPLLNCTECNFEYNRKLFHHLMKKQQIEDFPITLMYKPLLLPARTGHIYSDRATQVVFTVENRLIKNQKEKEKVRSQLKSHLMEVSSLIANNYRIFVHKEKDLKNTKLSSNSLSHNQLDYMTNKVDFNIDGIASKVIEKTKPIRNNLVEGIAFYSPPTIQREWEILRNPWYQNNIHCKPKFRKYTKYGPGTTAPISVIPYGNQHNILTRNFSDNNMRS